jgi:cytochrome o ubiquinol oxidase subunit 1
MSLFGRLDWDALDHDLIIWGADLGMIGMLGLVAALLFYTKRWKWLWKEYLTSLDPKRIGIMYIVVAALMLFKGLIDAGMLRAQQVLSVGESQGYLGAEHFQEIFSAHGTTMIFFVAMPIIFGMMNLLVPLQIGARDVAFPWLNSVAFWLFATGAVLVNTSLVIGKFSATGWLAYPPLSELEYSPGPGVDYWIWLLQIAGIGSLMTGVNFLVTILKMRCPGMTLMKMPMFIWSALCTLVLIIFAFPILTATLGMLALDRLMDMHFFTSSFGGNYMMYVNLIWAWGHPEVYILVLTAFGVFSEVVPTFSSKKLFGYPSMVWALVSITVLSFIVWLHHFFTMGATPAVNAFFGVTTIVIAVPTGVKIFNWIFTTYRGRVRFTTPMLWFVAFIIVFVIGGNAGVLLSIPPFDFQVHNSLFLIAHFHSVIIGGVLFGFFSAVSYWFPKITGFSLNDRLGQAAFWFWLAGFTLAFMPLYALGLMGATRRLDHYDDLPGWQPLLIVASVGFGLIAIGFGIQILEIIVSVKQRNRRRDLTGDPWDGRSLEWATSSPPPHYNFAVIPRVNERDAFWAMKQGRGVPSGPFEDFQMPKNSALGLYIGGFSFLLGFGLVWWIWWMALAGLIGIIVCVMVRMWDRDTEELITGAELEAHAAGNPLKDIS